MNRVEDIKARCERATREEYPEKVYGSAAYYCVTKDIPFLLAEVERLEVSNDENKGAEIMWRNRYQEAVTRAEKGKTMSEWISVKDRLPMYNKEVLTYTPGMAMPFMVDAYDGYYGEDDDEWYEGWRYRGNHAKNRITHWRPLPEPPKEAHHV